MSDQTYEWMLRDTVFLMVKQTEDESIYATTDFDAGYRSALYSVLSLIQQQAEVFGLDKVRVGLGSFDSEAWLREGASYWNARPGGHAT